MAPKAPELQQLMRDRFKEANAEIAAIEAASAPLREQRDELRRQIAPLEAKERELNKQIKVTEDGLFELKNEVGSLVRALKGKTSAPGEEPALADTASTDRASVEGAD